jgi:hypothetical protein
MSYQKSEYPNGATMSGMVHVTERRLVPRHQTSKFGKIIGHQARPNTVCMIRNISPAGGLLLVGDALGLPEEFDLQVDGYSRRCVTRWRRLDRVGVKFKSIAAA